MFLKMRGKQKGVSLLELIISIMIFSIALMAFAFVFPSGYRLNMKNRRESRAAEIAEGIFNEIMTARFYSANATDPAIVNLPTWQKDAFSKKYEDMIPGNSIFYLPDNNDSNGLRKGIWVQILDPTYPPTGSEKGTLAVIRVTVAWPETRANRVIHKCITISGYRSKNHD